MLMQKLITRLRGKSANTDSHTARGGERLIWLADPLFMLLTQVRATGMMQDLQPLRVRVLTMLQEFQERARDEGVEASRVTQAMEVLGALVDHVVTSMPWGAEAGWKSLGRSRSSSARRPAQRLLEVARGSARDPGLGELICVALTLGFDPAAEGPDSAQINEVLAELVQLQSHGASPLHLSEAGSRPALRESRKSALPLWIAGFVVAVLVAALFIGLTISLDRASDPLAAQISALAGR
jgi:type VI secretion system protein ImpK